MESATLTNQMKKLYPEAFSLNGLFLLALLGGVIWFIYQRFDNHDWPETQGRVVETWISESYHTDRHNHRHTEYSFAYKYLYLVDKASYQGNGTSPLSYDTRRQAEEILAREFYKGQHIRVIYNPKNPAESNLYRLPF